MTTVALTLVDVEARASLIESSVEMVRVQIERNTLALGGAAYLCLADYQLRRLRSDLRRALPCMGHERIDAVADMLEKGSSTVGGHVRRIDTRALNVFERWNLRRVFRILSELDEVVKSLRLEAIRKRPYMPIAKESPELNSVLYKDAAMASLMFRRSTPDPAERYPDPDYGF